MGRRKIEIKAIKDDRNRSVTFLKRKGGLFKKAHELSVLCSVDVAVIIFGSNKKLYEYSSSNMRDLIGRYTFHGGPNEHKGPGDFNGGADDGSDDEADGTPPPPQNEAVAEPHMMPPHYPGQPPPPFPHFRHQTPSASPPIPNGVTFAQHSAATQQAIQRAHTPQPPPQQAGSRPASRNDMRRMPSTVPPPGPPPGPQSGHQVNGYAFMPHPAIYNPQAQQTMPAITQPGPQYPYVPPPPPPPTTHAPTPHMQQYVDERPSSLPPSFPSQGTQAGSLPPPPQPQLRHSVSPPQAHTQQLPQLHAGPGGPRTSPPQPLSLPPPTSQQKRPHEQPGQPGQPHAPQSQPQPQDPKPPTPVEPKTDAASEWPEVKKMPQRKQYSIFTPIDESRSILSQHLAAFRGESVRTDSVPPGPGSTNLEGGNSSGSGGGGSSNANGGTMRSQSVDSGSAAARSNATASPPNNKAGVASASQQMPQPKSRVSMSSIPETMFTPPSRQNSLRPGGPLRPRLRVEIPPDESEDNVGTGTGGSASSPRNASDAGPLGARRSNEPHASIVLPPPSPSASALLSAGASGPPNPFARPAPHQNSSSNNGGSMNSSSNNGGGNMHIDTPGSALPSRFLNNELLPSPSSFYPDWGFGRSGDSATLPSPLNFATPVVGTGPSFLRDDHMLSNKRKSPETSAGAPSSSDPIDGNNDAKRFKADP